MQGPFGPFAVKSHGYASLRIQPLSVFKRGLKGWY